MFPPTTNQIYRKKAKRKGRNPDCLNLAKVASKPIEVIAIVSAKVPIRLIIFVTSVYIPFQPPEVDSDVNIELSTITPIK